MQVNLNVYPFCHSYYQEMIDNPPEGITYTGLFELGEQSYTRSSGVIGRALPILENRAELAWKLLETPSFRAAFKGDLVHAERILLNDKPYVLSLDHVGFLTDYKYRRMYRLAENGVFKKYLLDENCRKILPWSKASRQSLINLVGHEVEEKIEVVYPAIRSRDFPENTSDDTITLLFVAKRFYMKGGLETLLAYRKLAEEYDNLELIMITDAPHTVKQSFQRDEITFLPPTFERDELFQEFYSKADIFVLPTHNDSFGVVFLEAMNCGLPIVSTQHFATPEIIADGETGLLTDAPEISLFNEDFLPNPYWTQEQKVIPRLRQPDLTIVKQLVEHLRTLIEDESLRKQLGREGEKEIRNGKFSIQKRNKKLARIYQKAAE